jgi:Leucine-rich repeat (LRR) protein
LTVLDNNSVDLLSRCKNLKYLDLSENYLQKLPNNMDLLKNLEMLDLNGNPFQEIELAVESLKSIGPSLVNININLFEED